MIRASVPKLLLDDAFEQKNEIAKAVEDELEKVMWQHKSIIVPRTLNLAWEWPWCTYPPFQAMSAYGYEIVQTLIVDIEPDEHVKRAMNEINAGKSHLHLVNSNIFIS